MDTKNKIGIAMLGIPAVFTLGLLLYKAWLDLGPAFILVVAVCVWLFVGVILVFSD